MANIILFSILHLQELALGHTFNFPRLSSPIELFVLSGIMGVIYGVLLGVTDYLLDKRSLRRRPMGQLILFKSIIFIAVVLVSFALIRGVFFRFVLDSQFAGKNFTLSVQSWKYILLMLTFYYFLVTVVINWGEVTTGMIMRNDDRHTCTCQCSRQDQPSVCNGGVDPANGMVIISKYLMRLIQIQRDKMLL